MRITHILPAALAASILLASAAGAAAFTKSVTYEDGTFPDVPAGEWYAAEVRNTYELGLMKGDENGNFNPEGSVTVAEALTMACRAHSIYNGTEIPAAEGEWYQTYVNYASANGFGIETENYDRPALRYEVASAFKKAMPADYFNAKNDVKSIPDVSEKLPYAADLLTLYKAGIVMGSDAYGNFRPMDNITRAESAAIINRVALPENRLAKTLDVLSDDDAYVLIYNDTYTSNREGINSGWRLDNRGGTPRLALLDPVPALMDTETDAGTALIREFNKTTAGLVTLRTKVIIGDIDGAYLEYRNEAGDVVYRAETKNGAWMFGTNKLADAGSGTYTFVIRLDLDNRRVNTVINGTDTGTLDLAVSGDAVNLASFAFGTTEAGTAALVPGAIRAFVNYPLYDDFSFTAVNGVPFEWNVSEGTHVENAILTVPENGYAYKEFTPVSGMVANEFAVILPNREKIAYELRSGAKTVMRFENDENAFYVNGEKVYENYYSTVWYKLRFNADTESGMITFKVNGIEYAKVPFAEATTSIDNIAVYHLTGEKNVQFDRFRTFRVFDREDYVAAPVAPKGGEKYTVGINVCSIWQNGWHTGWSNIAAYTDREPVLGFYDEMNAETADWEIKYMVEHGIDFQAFCWFANSAYQPLTDMRENEHLVYGYKEAKYSDSMKYCINWETGNGYSPASFNFFKDYYVPYFVENFFKDPRYLVIDNKPVILNFGASKLIDAFGGASATNTAFEYLRDEAKKLGFDGVLIIASHTSDSQTIKAAGYDGVVTYNWGNSGYSLDVNKSNNIKYAEVGATYNVPCISVGFNSAAWANARYPMMSMDDYAAAHKWVRDEYLPKYAKEDWQKNLTLVSTWNEYGEGTFVMPTTDEKGFGYLDVLRKTYTDETECASVDVLPTDAQKARINRMYPQDQTLLRAQLYEEDKNESAEEQILYTFDFRTDKHNSGNMTDGTTTSEGYAAVAGGDPLSFITLPGEAINCEDITQIRITMKVPKDDIPHFFYTTSESGSYGEDKRVNFKSTSDEMTTYSFDTKSFKSWSGTLTGFRLDASNVPGNEFVMQKIEFVTVKTAFSNKMTINGAECAMTFSPKKAKNGDILVAFDPDTAMDFLLDIYHIWNRDDKTLTLYFKNHTVVFTVGADSYTLDGKSVKLGYTLGTIDSLPLIPLERLCKDVGYTFKLNDKKSGGTRIEIETPRKAAYTDSASDETYGTWNFDAYGKNCGWSSTNMNLLALDGALKCDANGSTADVNIYHDVEMPAEAFKTFETRVRYNYPGEKPSQFTVYFITDADPKWSEQQTFRFTLKGTDSGDEWETYTVDLTKESAWCNTVTKLRVDPFAAIGSFEFDYIKFIADPDFVYVDPADKPFAINNPDAEKTGNVAFSSINGKVTIIEDPDDSSNHCYLVMSGMPGQKNYTYIQQSCKFTAGAKYHVEADIRLAAEDENMDIPDDLSGSIMFNPQFRDPKAVSAGVNHIVKSMSITKGDGWQHFECDFEIPDTCTDRSGDVFSFYANPSANGLGLGFCLDNVVVEETKPE